MDDQNQLIRAEIDLMKDIRAKGTELAALIERIAQHNGSYVQQLLAKDDDTTREEAAFNAAEPGRWLSIARTTLQTGIMQLTRAVARPTSF